MTTNKFHEPSRRALANPALVTTTMTNDQCATMLLSYRERGLGAGLAGLMLAALACGTTYSDPIRGGPGGDGGPGGTSIAGSGLAGGGHAAGSSGSGGGAGSSPSTGGAGTGGAPSTTPLPATLPSFCTTDGWCGANLTFSAIWGTRPDDTWVVAKGLGDNPAASVVLRWDGAHWTTMSGARSAFYTDFSDLEAIWGTGPDDVWVVGSMGTTRHWNGTAWTDDYVGGAANFNAVWGSGPSDVWAVGEAGLMAHWDGASWTLTSGPYKAAAAGITTARLSGLWGSSAHDVWAVGEHGLILHWDGLAWSPYTDALGGTATAADLRAVWGSAARDVWAVGAHGTVLHFDGAHWSLVERQVPTDQDLKAVFGRGAGDVWVAGAAGALLHFTDGAWYTVPAKTTEALNAVWGSSAGELWAVGERAAAIYWNRRAWSATTPRPVTSDLLTVAAHDPESLWVAGGNTAAGAIAHWDGAAWSQLDTGPGALNAMVMFPDGTGAQVAGDGGKILSCSLFESYVVCTNLAPAATPDMKTIFAVGDDGWAGGAGGVLYRRSDSGWRAVPSPLTALPLTPTPTVTSIWGATPGDVWAATDSDQILHWDGSAWAATTLPGGGNGGTQWRLVTGTDAQHVLLTGMTSFSAYKAGGAYAVAAHWDGTAWTVSRTSWPTEPGFALGAWSSGAADLWLASPGPYRDVATTLSPTDHHPIVHWNGQTWSQLATGVRAGLFSVAGTAAGDLWPVGIGGAILHRAPRAVAP